MVTGFIEKVAFKMSLKGCIRVKYNHRNPIIGTESNELHKLELSTFNFTRILSIPSWKKIRVLLMNTQWL